MTSDTKKQTKNDNNLMNTIFVVTYYLLNPSNPCRISMLKTILPLTETDWTLDIDKIPYNALIKQNKKNKKAKKSDILMENKIFLYIFDGENTKKKDRIHVETKQHEKQNSDNILGANKQWVDICKKRVSK